jgi:uncharacterized protein (TIGR01777 family)
MKVAIPGATGMIGTQLVKALIERGDEPIVLTRSPQRARERFVGLEARRWAPEDGDTGGAALDGVDAIVNLAGEPIHSGRWTKARKKRIRDSRVLGTRRIVKIVSGQERPPQVLIAGSAVGYYGSRGADLLREEEPAGEGFLARVCQELEREADRATEFGTRVVRIRTGVVLSASGGALQKILRPFRMGLGGRIAGGRQWLSWVHISDIVGVVMHCLKTGSVSGAINATSPGAVTNSEFTRALGDILCRPTLLPVPAFALRMIYGEMASILVSSQRAVSDRVVEKGYTFRFGDLRPALKDCMSGGQPE